MNATAPRIAADPAVLDRVMSLLGITAAWSPRYAIPARDLVPAG